METTALIKDEVCEKILSTAEALAPKHGAEKLTVRMILREMQVSNRVFYNRFKNVEEVLNIVYQRVTVKMRESILQKFDDTKDFFTQIIEIVANTLRLSYDTKKNFFRFVFATDSLLADNFLWWKEEIKKLIEYGKANGLLRDLDSEGLSYAIWCFIRGYNADALARKLPKDEAVQNFKYAFSVFLEGMKA